jgi:hypothetical protein
VTAAALTADRIMSITIVAALAAVAFQTFAHLANAWLLDYRVWNLNADGDGNALSWVSSMVTFAAALSAAAIGLTVPHLRRTAFALALVLAFFSLDDIVAIHEELGKDVREDLLGLPRGAGRLIWPVLFFPLLGFTFLAVWQIAKAARARAAKLLRLALLLLVVAVAAEAAWSVWFFADGDTQTWPDALQVAFEEGAELGAWILITGAFAATAYVWFLRGQGMLRGPNGLRS